MFRKSLIILGMVLAVVLTYRTFFEKRAKLVDGPPLEDVLPDPLKQVYLKQQGRESTGSYGSQASTTSLGSAATAPTTDALLTEFTGNGIGEMSVRITNTTGQTQPFVLEQGQLLESGRTIVMVATKVEVDVPAAQSIDAGVKTIAVRSGNTAETAAFRKSPEEMPRLLPLLNVMKNNPNLPPVALQVAALVAEEDPPLASLASFPVIDEGLPVRSENPALKTDAATLLQALAILKTAGTDLESLSLVKNPQTKLQSMVNRATHDLAKEVFECQDRRLEWAYWKDTLLEGDMRLRHYALHGIARFYPDIAVQMLPKWGNDRRLRPVYRIASIYALVDTGKPAAAAALKQMRSRTDDTPSVQTAIEKASRLATEGGAAGT